MWARYSSFKLIEKINYEKDINYNNDPVGNGL